jgi:hypothetical protein
MPPLRYHEGQLAIQEEAETSGVADILSRWVGPIEEFAQDADLFLLATRAGGELRFTVLAGEPSLVQIVAGPELRLRFHPMWAGVLPRGRCGGLAINLPLARRVRLNGELEVRDGAVELRPMETFTLCRMYMAPLVSLESEVRVGPARREPIPLDDPWLAALVGRAETAFLASVSPDGGPDIAHRGGPPGFLALDPAQGRVSWTEFVGDGVFKSAGNIRATGTFTLLIPDFETGDGVELHGRASYTNVKADRTWRREALVQHRDPFPTQGRMDAEVAQAYRLDRVVWPRSRAPDLERITSCATADEQAPQ